MHGEQILIDIDTRRFTSRTYEQNQPVTRHNKFVLLWGEAQLCLPYVCLKKKITKIIDPMKSQVKYSSIQVFEYSSI